jgi:hypothetical protein
MSAALTVEPRHLDLPLGALFRPEELVIGPSTTAAEYQQLGAGLSKLANADKLWQCDYALWGMKKFGAKDGLELAALSTGLRTSFLKRCARIAERFDPSRRYPNLTCHHYARLIVFPAEFTDKWLPTVCDRGLSAPALRSLAVEVYGSDPAAAYTKKKKRRVSLSLALYSRISEFAPNKVGCFVEHILENWLKSAQKDSPGSAEAAGNETADAQTHPPFAPGRKQFRPFTEARDFVRTLKLTAGSEWSVWSSSGQRPADIPSTPARIYRESGWSGWADFLGYPDRAERRAVREKEKAEKRAAARAKQEALAAEPPRPTYGERRAAQKRAQIEQRVALWNAGTPPTKRLDVLYVTCRGQKKGTGVAGLASLSTRVTRFSSKEEAEAANAYFKTQRGHSEAVEYCENCSAWHLRHIYSSEVPQRQASQLSSSAVATAS